MRLVLFCQHSALVAHLEAEVAWLKVQMLHERERAENAIDQLLAVRANIPRISPARVDAVAQQILDELKTDDEFTHAGDLG